MSTLPENVTACAKFMDLTEVVLLPSQLPIYILFSRELLCHMQT